MTKTAITVRHISKYFGQLKALNDIHFTIRAGEFFALLGPNGAGKTTLISILASLMRQDKGQVLVMGYDTLLQSQKARQQIGVVPQELTFDPFFTVHEALRFQSGYFGLNRNDDWIDEIITRLALTEKAHVRIRKLSGGLKRRLMIAQALVHRPSVIVLDEPTAGVDIELRQNLWKFIQELNQLGHTILLTTHYLEEAETLCNRIAMLKQGKLVLLEKKDKLLQHTHRRMVTLRLTSALPSSLFKKWLHKEENGYYTFCLDQLDELPNILNVIKKASASIQEINIAEVKLEDIFLATMHQEKII